MAIRSPLSSRSRRQALILALSFWLAPAACVARPETSVTTAPVAPGITLTQETTTGAAPLIIDTLRIDLKVAGVHVRCGQAQDAITLNGPTKGREALHTLATRNGAVAAINADFFPFTGDPLGLAIRDGELLSEPTDYRACFGVSPKGVLMDVLAHYGALDLADGTPLLIDGINRVPHGGEIVVLTPTYAATPRLEKPSCVITLKDVNLPVKVSSDMRGTVTSVVNITPSDPLPACPMGGALLVACGSTLATLATHCKVDDAVHFRFDLTSNGLPPARGKYPGRAALSRNSLRPCWADVEQAVGGGPWLVKNGVIAVDWESEGLSKSSFVEARHPRTALGVAADGKLLLVTVDGRFGLSRGATLDELAQIMKRLGAVNAINLDGGGSSTMVVDGSVVNAPSDGRERPIADGLLVYSDAAAASSPSTDGPEIAGVAGSVVTLHAGESIPLQIVDKSGMPLTSLANAIWGTGDGLGYVSQKGVFSCVHAGSGSIIAHVGGQVVQIPVQVLCGAPAVVKATLTSIANYPAYYNQLSVTVTDRYGNPVQGLKLNVQLEGGQLEAPLTTDSSGHAGSQIVWDAEPTKRLVHIVAGVLPAKLIRGTSFTSGAGKGVVPIDPDDR